uniref:BTB domain-containing protein n=1 Tax=Panagrolaimus davidi TaxID=227884 RepID=A0A914QP50_9BILA
MQRKYNESQNSEMFDVVFEVEGKKLYAHKFRLSTISTTFESMVSDRWISKDNVIPIKDYSFNDFKEFLTFIYTGKCSLTEENIFAMIDIAEFYQVNSFKKYCDEYLSKMTINMENIFQLIEISAKYSLLQMKKPMHIFISENFSTLIKYSEFLNVDKSVIGDLVLYDFVQPEETFQIVYEWSENQAMKKRNDENFNKNDAIKAEITPFLSNIEFKHMDSSFISEYVVKKDFLFAYNQFHVILLSDVKVQITCQNGNIIYGYISRESSAFEIIQLLKNRLSENEKDCFIYWKNPNNKIPLIPSSLKKRVSVHWYLVYCPDGDIAVVNANHICERHFIIAEMFLEKYFFSYTPKCKIEIV